MKLKIVKRKAFKFSKVSAWEPYEGFTAAFVLTPNETVHMSAIIFKVDPGFSVEGTMSVEEIEYILKGSFKYSHKGKISIARKGDIVLLPKGAKVIFSTDTGCECLAITYPHLKKNAVARARVLSSGKSR